MRKLLKFLSKGAKIILLQTVRLARYLALKNHEWLAPRPKEPAYVNVGGLLQSEKDFTSPENMKNQLPVTKDFSIDLCKLMHGLAGNTRTTVLYFYYNSSFDNFLTVLRSETSLQTGKGVGYTLEDGPWSYKIERNSAIEGGWCDITDEASFLDMTDKLKSADGRAMVFHVSRPLIYCNTCIPALNPHTESKMEYKSYRFGEREQANLEVSSPSSFRNWTSMNRRREPI